jgi:hypothetical protein
MDRHWKALAVAAAGVAAVLMLWPRSAQVPMMGSVAPVTPSPTHSGDAARAQAIAPGTRTEPLQGSVALNVETLGDTAGREFRVVVSADFGRPVALVEFGVDIDTGVAQVVAVAAGELAARGRFEHSIGTGDGRLHVSLAAPAGGALRGRGTIAVLEMRRAGPGGFHVSLADVRVIDAAGAEVDVNLGLPAGS